jgi:hypothetical protein
MGRSLVSEPEREDDDDELEGGVQPAEETLAG